MQSSPRIIAKIKSSEGWSSTPYWDGGSPGVGTLTIGWGFTAPDFPGGRIPDHMSIADGDGMLVRIIRKDYEPAVDALDLENQNQYDACVDAAYNLGPGILGPGYTLGRALIARAWGQAAQAFLLYVHANGQVYQGLVIRRTFERKLFLTPDPHGYLLFDTIVRRDLIPGRAFAEHELVREYDRKRHHPKRYPLRLRRLRQDLGACATRLERVASRGGRLHWNHKLNQQWRHAQLLGRSQNRQYVP